MTRIWHLECTGTIRKLFPVSQYTILCVDDDEAICQLYQAAFAAWGHRALTVLSPSLALQAIRSEYARCDAVLLDYEMPEMNGAQLAAEIKHHQPNVPIVMVSGNAEIVRNAPESVDIAIPKGSDLVLLISQIEKLVAARRKEAAPVRWTVADAASA